MKKKHTFRTLIILSFLVLAGIYIYPTFTLTGIEQLERDKIDRLAEISGIPASDIYADIYRDDVDFLFDLEQRDLEEEVMAEAGEIVEYLRSELYDKLVSTRSKAIKKGLDLQGGMHIVLEVDLVRMMDNLARKKDDQYHRLLDQVSAETENADVDFFDVLTRVFDDANVPLNTYFGDLRSTQADIRRLLEDESADAVNRSLEILSNRVDEFGVSEPSIRRQGSQRIVLELPGVQDPARARGLVGKTALLEFKLLADPENTQRVLSEIDRFMKRDQDIKKHGKEAVDAQVTDQPDSAAADTTVSPPKESKDEVMDVQDLFGEEARVSSADTSLLVDGELVEEHPFYTLLRNVQNNIGVPQQNYSLVNRILHRREVIELIPSGYQFLWSKEPETAPDGNKYYSLYYLKKEPELTGAYLRDAQVQIGSGSSPGSAGLPTVSFELNRQGARIFSRVTGANTEKFLAIVLDEKVHMAPRIKTKIPDGRGIIEGSSDMEEARDLAIVLRAGALPAPVDIIEERTVGPSLGHDSVSQGTVSGLSGLAVVILFMIWYYRLGGIIADLALMLNLVFVMSILAGFHGTLTLPGIAGIILTIGMAVDANVLIFERIREELRTGKTVKASIDAGYSRAIVTILDANVTTLIAAVVLYQFGSGPMRGFALTLMIGIIASMFTAIVVTRAVFDWITGRFTLKTLKI